jgi:TonB family protein
MPVAKPPHESTSGSKPVPTRSEEPALIQKTQPIYPPIAKAARVSGTVVLKATISKTGEVEHIRVVNGPPLFQQAALDAVKTWRYSPSLLNNQPVEVEKTVTVQFVLGAPSPQEAALPDESSSAPIVASSSPSSDDELIEQSLARLKKGNLAYNTPEKMKTGSTARVTARIGAGNISMQTLESGMPTDQGTKIETAPTPVSTKMKMMLKSADFDITPLSSEEQIIGGDTPTEWDWDVSPKRAGTLHLHLASVVELRTLSRDFTTVDREIAVQVDPFGAVSKFAEANAVWILTTVGAGFAGLWAWLKKRKKSKVPSWETP